MKKIYLTREAWLLAAVEQMRPTFNKSGYSIPPVRVSCGWPSKGGVGVKSRSIGQCWAPNASSDGKAQIFISPWLENKDDTDALPTLVHEIVHAVVGLEAKHGKVFKTCAIAVGLEGKMTATYASESLMKDIVGWNKALGYYPHAKLNPKKSPVKTQTTRMIKMECAECGYVARTARKWLELYGPVECPGGHGETSVENKD